MKPYYEHAGITIYHADCREVSPSISGDCVVTDPPYGVFLGEAGTTQEKESNRGKYSAFSDTPAYLSSVVIPAFTMALGVVKRAAITPGNRNAHKYPEPSDIGVWYQPAGSGIGRWGWVLAHLIFYYGTDPRQGKTVTPASFTGYTESVGEWRPDHPCPKPLAFMKWLVNKASLEQEVVIDPFMGIGTTLVACKNLNRFAIGIEIEERYCEIAAKRLSQEVFDFTGSVSPGSGV